MSGAGLAAWAAEAFTPAERAVIARNASLRAALPRDPALVRHALDAMEAPRAYDPGKPGTGTRDMRLGTGVWPDFDAGRDPDLGAMQRASPEAANDLFQLLKQASGTKGKAAQ